jgi:hypothetical protein
MRLLFSCALCAFFLLLLTGCSGEGVKSDVNRAIQEQKADKGQPVTAKQGKLKSMRGEPRPTVD